MRESAANTTPGRLLKRSPRSAPAPSPDHRFIIELGRAYGGALIFSLPMLITMEMWWLGFYINHGRLALLLLLAIPLLVRLAHDTSLRERFEWRAATAGALTAYAVGFVTAAVILTLMAIIRNGMSADEVLGKIAIQSVPGSIGAALARQQLGGGEGRQERKTYKLQHLNLGGELFLRALGALFLSLSLASTEEMVLIAYKMTTWHSLALALASLAVIQAFVVAVIAQDKSSLPPGTPGWRAFLHSTVSGYAIVLLISAYVLWTFQRTDNTALSATLSAVVVVGFPASVGAGAARLIL